MWACKKFTRRTLFNCTVRQLNYDNLTFGNYSGDPNIGYFFVNFCSSSIVFIWFQYDGGNIDKEQ